MIYSFNSQSVDNDGIARLGPAPGGGDFQSGWDMSIWLCDVRRRIGSQACVRTANDSAVSRFHDHGSVTLHRRDLILEIEREFLH